MKLLHLSLLQEKQPGLRKENTSEEEKVHGPTSFIRVLFFVFDAICKKITLVTSTANFFFSHNMVPMRCVTH